MEKKSQSLNQILSDSGHIYRFFFICILFLGVSCEKNTPIRFNQIQIIGSHNSYKQPIQEELWQQIFQEDSIRAMELDYGHVGLTEQLNMGLRGLELDIFYDPQGGRYTNPLGLQLVKSQDNDSLPFDIENKLTLPGLKVFHIQDIDFRSNSLLFKDALKELKQWSAQHKGHIPIIITMNAKDQVLDLPDFTKPLTFDAEALASIDKEILAVFDSSQLITPDFVRQEKKTLEQSILEHGWPTLDESKGKFLFVLDEMGEKMATYGKSHPSLKNRVMFTISEPGNPESAFLIINDPIKHQDSIQKLVRQGYMVRTRADAGTWEARKNDYTRWNAALKSGAQVISTDYYLPNPKFNTSYQIKFDSKKTYEMNPLSDSVE
ncbi:phosphatidylinositol-specific phospholipase C1-like protein [Maribacter sp. 2304DJ31-5]|uniref:phosphatidylinositol-specific phospholipase C1-like protein n=1 Tax=Maribacter sp. 2304DJ31-5 TaxID=3386273 RepID=UPI0039BC2E30